MLYSITGIIILFLFWFVIGRIIVYIRGAESFEGFLPANVIKSFINLTVNNFFWISVLTSLSRIIIGLIIAAFTGLPIGILIGFYKYLREITNIPIHFIRMISPIAWMPIAIIILPSFNQAIIFLIFISTVWPILLNTSQGVSNVKPEWIKMAQNQGAKDYQLLFKIIIPASVPYILTGLRLAIGAAWIVLIPAEMLGVTSGLGYLINDARDTLEYDKLVALVLAIGLLGFIIDNMFQYIQYKLDWRNL